MVGGKKGEIARIRSYLNSELRFLQQPDNRDGRMNEEEKKYKICNNLSEIKKIMKKKKLVLALYFVKEGFTKILIANDCTNLQIK
jgi:hypothetical protein